MSLTSTWRLGDGSDSRLERLYDALRRRVNARLVHFLIAARPKRTLEAGSGTAYATGLFAKEPGVEVAVCVDCDAEALRLAKERNPNLQAVVADIRRLPFKDGTLDLVFSSSTVEHLDDPHAAVMEMTRVCRSGGRVFVGVPHAIGPLFFQPMIRNTKLGIWLGPVFGRSALDRMLRECGLMPVASLRYFFRFFVGAVGVKGEAVNKTTSGIKATKRRSEKKFEERMGKGVAAGQWDEGKRPEVPHSPRTTCTPVLRTDGCRTGGLSGNGPRESSDCGSVTTREWLPTVRSDVGNSESKAPSPVSMCFLPPGEAI